MDIGLRASDDRNREHWEGFEHYRVLQGKHFKHALEIGCGPFTNLRHIATTCKIDQCALADPLIKDYLTHPRASYTNTHLFTQRTTTGMIRFAQKCLYRLLPQARRLGHARIPISDLIGCPVEELKPNQKYDLIVFINVIEHCYDANRAFATLNNCLAPGGLLVFCDKLYDCQEVKKRLQSQYDATHPLRIDESVIRNQLALFTNPIYSEIKTFTSRVENHERSYDALYYIGEKAS